MLAEPRVKPKPTNIAWQANPGSQELFVACPIFEALYEGTRGPGKTEALIASYLQFVGKGFERGWRGIIFRRTYPELEEVIFRSRPLIQSIFPDAKYNESSKTWKFPQGETLKFRYAFKHRDYWMYHGHEYPFVGWDELCTWPDLELYQTMKSVCRSTYPGMPRMYRSTANPYGVGHGAVKAYFVDNCKPGQIVKDGRGNLRTRIRGYYWENRHLVENDPEYINLIMSDPNESRRKAWTEGDWDIVAGGFFSEAWDNSVHLIRKFVVPEHWKLRRGFDWGYSAPASLGLWAISPGEEHQGIWFPRHSAVCIDELYTVKKDRNNVPMPNEGQKLTNYELGREIARTSAGMSFSGCVADPSIFTESGGDSIYTQLRKGASSMQHSLTFIAADNNRKAGWQKMLEMMAESKKDNPEAPCLYVTQNCTNFIRTVPVLMRDDKDPDDIDTETEDHIGDQTRYLVQSLGSSEIKSKRLRGA